MRAYSFRYFIAAYLAGIIAVAAAPALALNEDEVGRKYHAELSKEYRVYKDPRVTEIGEKVSKVAGVTGVEFFAIDMGKDDQPNAFQIPNHIYATKSLLKDFDDISVTFIMGHELGHQVGHHLAKQNKRNTNVGIGAILLGTLLGVGSNTAGGYAINIAGGAIVNDYSREQEDEADLFGLQVIHDLGIPFQKAAEAFEKLGGGRSENRTLNVLFGSHPMMKDRISRTGSADEWLSMRPVDVFSTGGGNAAVIWQYTGDKAPSDKASEIRTGTVAAMKSLGHQGRALDESTRVWTKLNRVLELPADELKGLGETLGARWLVVAKDLDADKFEGAVIDSHSGESQAINWKFDTESELARQISQATRG